MMETTEEMQGRMDRLQAERNDMMVALMKINETNRDKHGTPAKQLKRCKELAANAMKGIQP
jgi:hypothetical protein